MKNITKEQKETFLRLAGWIPRDSYSGDWMKSFWTSYSLGEVYAIYSLDLAYIFEKEKYILC